MRGVLYMCFVLSGLDTRPLYVINNISLVILIYISSL